MCIPCQEGYVGLEIMTDFKMKIHGYYSDKYDFEMLCKMLTKLSRRDADYFAGILACRNPGKKFSNERNICFSLRETKKLLDEALFQFSNDYDPTIAVLQKKMQEAETPKKRSYYNDEVRKMLRLKSRCVNGGLNQIPTQTVLYSLQKILPKKFCFEKEYEMKFPLRRTRQVEKRIYNPDGTSRLISSYQTVVDPMICNLKTINFLPESISYLQQQHDLGRIFLDHDHLAMLNAFKEVFKVQSEGMTFDSFINSWARKLVEDLI
jgi:hypothetical protein